MRPLAAQFLRSSAIVIFLGLVPFSLAPAHAQTVACEPPVVVNSAPPPLPVYTQPPLPGPGYIWTPGYWSWDSEENDYYWVPGTWVEPPRPGLLWTPGYWGWVAGAYVFHQGYWGPHIGFYGGIYYGHGYDGEGFEGGRWRDGRFYYNRSVTNISNTNITNVYEQRVPEPQRLNRASFNGGNAGIQAHPTPQQKAFAKEQHFAATPVQQHNVVAASKDTALSIKTNHGKPPVAATAHPAVFKGPGVTPTGEEKKAGEPMHGAKPATELKPALGSTMHRARPAVPAATGKPGMTVPGVMSHRPAAEGHPAMPAHPAPGARSETLAHPTPRALHAAPHPAAPRPMAEHPAEPHPIVPHPALPHPIVPHPALPHPMAPHPAPPHPIRSARVAGRAPRVTRSVRAHPPEPNPS